MPRILPIAAVLVVQLVASFALSGQTPDPRLDDALKEIASLKRNAAEQDMRMASLERTMKALQATVLAATRPVPMSQWRTPAGWAAIKIGMSRAQVVEILGEPRSMDAVIDRQTLVYKEANDLIGNVVLTDDRVSEVTSHRFQIYLPLQK